MEMKSPAACTFEQGNLWFLNQNKTTTVSSTIKFHAFSYCRIDGAAVSQTANDSEPFA